MSPLSLADRLKNLPADELQLLRERARQIARVVDESSESESIDLLEVVCRGQTYAIPLTKVEGIAELGSFAVLPNVPAYVLGLVSFRGEILVGVDLSTILGAGQVGFADLRRVICLAAGGKKLALLAERVMTVRAADPASFARDPLSTSTFVVGIDDRFASLLNVAAFIEHAFAGLGGTR